MVLDVNFNFFFSQIIFASLQENSEEEVAMWTNHGNVCNRSKERHILEEHI